MANEDLSAACGAPVTETETQFLLHLVRAARDFGVAELRYKDLFVRFHRAEGGEAPRVGGAGPGERAAWAPAGSNTVSTYATSFQIPDMSK